jgi:lipid A 3-O-deacylase
MIRYSVRHLVVVAAVLGAMAPATGQAQAGEWSVREDNGNLAVWVPSRRRSDDNYTQGLSVTMGLAHPWAWFARLLSAAPMCPQAGASETDWCAVQRITVGQEIYTPTRDPLNPVPGDRPYAGWLYGAMTTSVISSTRWRGLSASVGVIGPPSLAAWTQNTFHAVTGLGPPILGWRHQLAFEPGVILSYGERYLVVDSRLPHGLSFELAPDWEASLGNVRTATRVGVRARIGLRRATPWGGEASPFDLYLVAGAHEDWVLRNLFIDGSTFSSSEHARSLPWTSQTDIGPGARLFGYTIEVRLSTQAREYRGGPAGRLVGSVIIGHTAAW